MALTKTILLPVLLRLVFMLTALVSLQLTYNLYSHELFVTLNIVTFLIGLHTALSYSSQVEIWENGHAGYKKVWIALAIALLIALAATLILNAPVTFLLGAATYIIYRFFDRISFNLLLTQTRLITAYITSITVVIIEILCFTLLSGYTSENITRFLVPGVLAGSLSLTFVAWVTLRHTTQLASSTRHPSSSLAFACHSLAILMVIMFDRIIPALRPELSYIDARYLLLFSYVGALYSIGTAVLEPLRPQFFKCAKEVNSLKEYLRVTRATPLIVAFGAISGAAAVLGIIVVVQNDFSDPNSLDQLSRDFLVTSGLISFFSAFIVLAFLQMFFLSRRLFLPIYISWAAAFCIRLLSLMSGRVDLYLAMSIASAVISILILVIVKNLPQQNRASSPMT